MWPITATSPQQSPQPRELLHARHITCPGTERDQPDRRRIPRQSGRGPLQAIARLSVDQPDLIIADVNGQTLDLLDAVRTGDGLAGHVDPDTPMIVLSQRPDDIHRIRVLEHGGDDIIAKPFSYPELRARVAAVLRRAECRRHQRQLHVASLTIDLGARHVRIGAEPVELSAKEYELLDGSF